uniref:Uncharacterized protein n=1 Tax=Compsopogon caeruleus TaxID=31354 RepID=A0A7S1T4Q6_9RHOD|mmetsp:Transcript_10396/g.20958  ORF Transcript_10396/g.20958 Transcript_10396/m.20958 type:complete len:117 (+) Transcript_10396:157-507(+)
MGFFIICRHLIHSVYGNGHLQSLSGSCPKPVRSSGVEEFLHHISRCDTFCVCEWSSPEFLRLIYETSEYRLVIHPQGRWRGTAYKSSERNPVPGRFLYFIFGVLLGHGEEPDTVGK